MKKKIAIMEDALLNSAFLNSFWSIWVAGLLALLSFGLLHYGSLAKSRAATNKINDVVEASVDTTVKEMKTQIETVVCEVQVSSENSISAIKGNTKSIIDDLKLESTNATKLINNETKKLIDKVQEAVDKVDESANILTNDLVHKQLILRIDYKVTNLDDYEILSDKYCEIYTGVDKFDLKIESEKVKARYIWKAGDFKPVKTQYDTKRNAYNHEMDGGHVNVSNRFSIYYEFLLDGLIEGKLSDLIPEDRIIFFTIKSPFYQERNPSTNVSNPTKTKFYKVEPQGAVISTKAYEKKLELIKPNPNPFMGDENFAYHTNYFKIIE